ncbi:histidine kinase [Flagellimonas ochracea]|uniref:histidine kinase n=1 Tax=Flagellimonas ochracea TaxID=2696472 RepID=UPI001F1834F6|nr:histidine kinase [Allomuricauda ochracea]
MKNHYFEDPKPTVLTKGKFEDILIYFSRSLLGKASEEEILWDLAKNCIAKLGFVDCVIYLLDENNKLLVQKAAYGPKNPKDHTLYNPVQIMVGQGITGSVAKTGIPELIHDTSKDSRYIEDDAKRLSEICVPIADENVIYGVIDCEHPEKGFFNEYHLKMLSAVASICAIKIKTVRADKALREKQEKLLSIREEMVTLKFQALNSQLNPHFVFNALNAIQYFVTKENKKKALEYLSLFSHLIRFYLKNLEKDTILLTDEVDMLKSYLKLQSLRYDDSFYYTISLKDNNNDYMGMEIPSFVIHTLFENIIEQSVFKKQENQHFYVVFNILENHVQLKVDYRENEKPSSATPEYRQGIVQLQEQIDLLNSVKGYGITYKTLDEKQTKTKSIELMLPNLYSKS